MSGHSSLNDALQQHQAGNLELAARMYQSVLNENPQNADALHLLGLTEHQQGRYENAEKLIRQALAITPQSLTFLGNLAAVYAAMGRPSEAEACYRRALGFNSHWLPGLLALGTLLAEQDRCDDAAEVLRYALGIQADSVDVLNNLGEVEARRGHPDAAIDCFRNALAIAPDHPELHNNLGNILRESGELAQAESHLRTARKLGGDDPLILFNLGLTLLDQSRCGESVQCLQQAVALAPGNPEFHSHLAEALRRHETLPDAEAAAQRAIELDGNDARTHATLGAILADAGRLPEAVESLHRALDLDPQLVVSHTNLAEVLRREDRLEEAEQTSRNALRLAPDDSLALMVLAKVLRKQGRSSEAETTLRNVLKLEPQNAEVHRLLGLVLGDLARMDEAVDAYESALQIEPDSPATLSDQLLCRQYQSDMTASRLAGYHAKWNEQFARPQTDQPPHQNSRDADRPLRVGLISPDFRRHPVGQLVVKGLEALQDSGIHCVCYANQFASDDVTHRIESAVSLWRNVWSIPDAEVTKLIRADGIDILIDLAGHTGANRLQLFSLRPAPIQITWLGYAGTTGLTAMDYLLTDAHHVSPEIEPGCSETVVRLSGPHFVFEPPEEAPQVGPAPFLSNGFVTFGCFNNPAKLSRRCIKNHAAILHQVPDSRLVLKYRGFNDPPFEDQIRTAFQDSGVDPDRVECRGHTPFSEMLSEYNGIDISLDTFPFNGGMTSLLSLWMGVPVVTFPGPTVAGRQTASFLTHIEIPDSVAADADDYITTATSLASDRERLNELRNNLRHLVAKSPLCNADRFAADFQRTLRNLWHKWCNQ